MRAIFRAEEKSLRKFLERIASGAPVSDELTIRIRRNFIPKWTNHVSSLDELID